MSSEMSVNDTQRRSWDEVAGPKWIRHELVLERNHAPISRMLLAEAAARPGEAVLEIGCGTGTLLQGLADQVGPGGSVCGIDISATMLALARSRLPETVRLMRADAQTAAIGSDYDLMLSRFGVMFFDDPASAFAHLRMALRPDGRLCFVCWAGLDENPHWRDAMDVVARHLGSPAPRHAHAPGPLAFADPVRVRSLLEGAGFTRIVLRTENTPLGAIDAEEAATLAMSVGPSGALITERAPDEGTLAAIRAELMRIEGPRMATVHLVTARCC